MGTTQPLVCPGRGSDQLFSVEKAEIGYPVRADRRNGVAESEYTGESYLTFDEGTQYEDRLPCRTCVREWKLAELVPVTIVPLERVPARRPE